jgi:hypothetical protein
MIQVIGFRAEEMDNIECNNGNYPTVHIDLSNGETYTCLTCACGNGCSGMDVVPTVGTEFESMDEFMRYVDNGN